MGKRTNERFLQAYVELDKACCEKFGIAAGGVAEYINRLGNTRFAPGRDEVLPHLVKYRNIRNVFTYEPSAVRKNDELTSKDLTWINKFVRDISRKNDPMSRYLRKARRYMTGKRIKRYAIFISIVILIIVGVIIFFAYK